MNNSDVEMLPSPLRICYLLSVILVLFVKNAKLLQSIPNSRRTQVPCGSSELTPRLKYLRGDALTDQPNCKGPDGKPYPKNEVSKLVSNLWPSSRQGRSMRSTVDPFLIQRNLLQHYAEANIGGFRTQHNRTARSLESLFEGSALGNKNRPPISCQVTPERMCRSHFNTTAPMYGVSLTSGQPVTIVQKFPELLQQVVYEECESSECEVLHGKCIQTYMPYLFLVIPLGPVTLTGQDYVLVESGCVCQPRYSSQGQDTATESPLKGFQ